MQSLEKSRVCEHSKWFPCFVRISEKFNATAVDGTLRVGSFSLNAYSAHVSTVSEDRFPMGKTSIGTPFYTSSHYPPGWHTHVSYIFRRILESTNTSFSSLARMGDPVFLLHAYVVANGKSGAAPDSSEKPCERCARKNLLCEYIPVVADLREHPKPPPGVSTATGNTPRPSGPPSAAYVGDPNTSENTPYRPWSRRPHFDEVNPVHGDSSFHPVTPIEWRTWDSSQSSLPAGAPSDIYGGWATASPPSRIQPASYYFANTMIPQQLLALPYPVEYDQGLHRGFEYPLPQSNIYKGQAAFSRKIPWSAKSPLQAVYLPSRLMPL
ncbi:hypothetical protein C8R44DRAFT_734756 [Mycena epipterygia]|nr:hypothetical protein C8R44DRAFT_734756 [Mycena epipterygia]